MTYIGRPLVWLSTWDMSFRPLYVYLVLAPVKSDAVLIVRMENWFSRVLDRRCVVDHAVAIAKYASLLAYQTHVQMVARVIHALIVTIPPALLYVRHQYI